MPPPNPCPHPTRFLGKPSSDVIPHSLTHYLARSPHSRFSETVARLHTASFFQRRKTNSPAKGFPPWPSRFRGGRGEGGLRPSSLKWGGVGWMNDFNSTAMQSPKLFPHLVVCPDRIGSPGSDEEACDPMAVVSAKSIDPLSSHPTLGTSFCGIRTHESAFFHCSSAKKLYLR